VLERAFAQFEEALRAADAAGAPTERLEALAQAYLRFALEQPHAYRTMFDRRRGEGTEEMTQTKAPQDLLGAAAFGLLVDAVAAASPGTTDPMLDATVMWVGLHGYATLRDAVPAFPWPEEDAVLPRLLPRTQ